MSPEDRARAKAMRAQVLAEIPDAVPLIRDLHQAGLITGWRNVAYVGPMRETEGVTADVYLENSKALGANHGTAAESF